MKGIPKVIKGYVSKSKNDVRHPVIKKAHHRSFLMLNEINNNNPNINIMHVESCIFNMEAIGFKNNHIRVIAIAINSLFILLSLIIKQTSSKI